MADRFYCDDLSGQRAVLADSEAHHALHVLRLRIGAAIQLFDGRGTLAHGTVVEISRRELSIEVIERQFNAANSVRPLIIAAAAPKGDRLKWMIEKLTELGVDRFIPLQSGRSVKGAEKVTAEKLLPTVISASKQCNRLWLMAIEPAQSLAELLAAESPASAGQLWLAHPVNPAFDPVDTNAVTGTGRDIVLIGPEGGFDDEEVAQADRAGARRLTWPDTILRIETAAIMAAAVLRSRQVLP